MSGSVRSSGRHSNQHTFSDGPDRTPLYRTEPDEPGTFPILDPNLSRARDPKAGNTGENPGFRSETLRSHRVLWTPILRIWQRPISAACRRIQAGLVHNICDFAAHRAPAPAQLDPAPIGGGPSVLTSQFRPASVPNMRTSTSAAARVSPHQIRGQCQDAPLQRLHPPPALPAAFIRAMLPSFRSGSRFMNWQTPVALALVAVTAAAFLWRRFRPRRFSLARDTHCGCGSSPTGARPPGFRVEGRRGERPRITLTS